MDATHFDHLARRVAPRPVTRRRLFAGILGGLLTLIGQRGQSIGPVVSAKKGHRKKKPKKKPTPPKADSPRSCALQPYNVDTLEKRGLPTSATSNITFTDIPPTEDRPHYDRVDVEFFTALSFINACAKTHGVTVRPYSAYRSADRTEDLGGVEGSNHRAGHGIDMKVEYDGGICGWTECQHTGCLGTEPRFNKEKDRYEDAEGHRLDPLEWSDGPKAHGVEVEVVRNFIDCVRKSPSLYGKARKLRWG